MVTDNTCDGNNRALDGDKLMMDGQASTEAYPAYAMTPHDFIDKWRGSELKESSGSQEHFIDLCRLLGEPTPAEADPTGQTYCFERGARKDSGRAGWADVWKRGHFAWEYKGKHANLDRAFDQLRQYALALENPPLLIVSDMVRFRIRTNWTNSVSEAHQFECRSRNGWSDQGLSAAKYCRGVHLVRVAIQMAQDHALDRLAPLPGQQPLGVGQEGYALVAAREQELEALQIGLQRGLELQHVVADQLRHRGRDGGHDGTPGPNPTPATYPYDFSLQ